MRREPKTALPKIIWRFGMSSSCWLADPFPFKALHDKRQTEEIECKRVKIDSIHTKFGKRYSKVAVWQEYVIAPV